MVMNFIDNKQRISTILPVGCQRREIFQIYKLTGINVGAVITAAVCTLEPLLGEEEQVIHFYNAVSVQIAFQASWDWAYRPE